jgi:hypothetical protein
MKIHHKVLLSLCGRRYGATASARRAISRVVLAALVATGCTRELPDTPATSESNSALTAEQCDFFDVNGKVQLCHHTNSATHPFSIIRIGDQACIDAHAAHAGDFVTSTDPSSSLFDPTCQGIGCLSNGAPCDTTLPCCDGLTCSNGTCAPPCTLTDLEVLDLPNFWRATGTCGEFKLFVFDTSNTLLDPGVGTGLNIPLAPGTYAFTVRGDGFDNNGGSGPNSTLNIFSSCGNATGLVQGSSFTLGSSTVTVTSFTAARDGDSVSPCDESPNGQADVAGSVTLTVTSP